ncbi:MAG: PQQ-binding-like beta-propeller repeat protein [Hyphomicrobiaceae bacterium]|nr:PQQ-binding-like beta-propeller repeat protein [Hyphomicrobiaceae bacterium]
MKPKLNISKILFTASVRFISSALVPTALLGCSIGLSGLNSFDTWTTETDLELNKSRTSIVQKKKVANGELSSSPVILPKMFRNVSWSQPGGTPNNAPGHLHLSSEVDKIWSASIGSGSSSSGRLTASPLVAGGRIYTLDSRANVRVFSALSGDRLWDANLTPDSENSKEGFGGGLAFDSDRLYVATGFGQLIALDPANGEQLWEKGLGTPIRSSPTASNNKVFVTATDGRFFAISGDDGENLWSYRGYSSTTQISSNPSPAVNNDVVVTPYPNGDLVAIQISSGIPLWTENLSLTSGITPFTSMRDSTRPVILGGIVFANSYGGRMIATRQNTGERLWSKNLACMQPSWVTENNIFVIDLTGKLSAFVRRNGKLVWTVQLPNANTWSGPVLAGNKLWLTSDSGKLLSADARTGKVVQQLTIGTPIFIAPVVADSMLYVLSDTAQLIAYR